MMCAWVKKRKVDKLGEMLGDRLGERFGDPTML